MEIKSVQVLKMRVSLETDKFRTLVRKLYTTQTKVVLLSKLYAKSTPTTKGQVLLSIEVLVGKDKGKKGVIKKIVYERNWCFVEGLHLKFERSQIPDLIVRQEKPLLTTSEVALVDPSDSKSTEVEWRFLEDGTQVRVSKRSGRIIPFPPEAENLWEDFVDVSKYRASKTKDTAPKDLQEVTYKPKLCTFEEDILEQHGIKEDKKFQKKFWY